MGNVSTDCLDKKKLLAIVQSSQDIIQTYEHRYKTLKELAKEIDLLKEFITKEQQESIGKKLVQIGIILIAIPEPVVSNLGGAILIAGGLALNKINHAKSLNEIYTDINESLQELGSLRKDLISLLDLKIY